MSLLPPTVGVERKLVCVMADSRGIERGNLHLALEGLSPISAKASLIPRNVTLKEM